MLLCMERSPGSTVWKNAVFAEWVTRWLRKGQPDVRPRQGEADFTVQSLEPRLLLSTVLEGADPRTDRNLAGDAVPVAEIQIDPSSYSSVTETPLKGLSVALTCDAAEVDTAACDVTATGRIDVWDYPLQSLAEKGIRTLVIQGMDETDDTLVVDLSCGDLPLAVTFHGGDGGYDTLIVTGVSDGAYAPGAVYGDGTVQAGASSISFTGLEPVIIDGASSFTFTTPGSQDIIRVDSLWPGWNRVSGTSDNAVFESVSFTHVTSFVIDTATNDADGSDNDTITIASNLVASGLQNLTIASGSGDDILYTSDLSLPLTGGTFSFDGGEDSDRIVGPSAATTWSISSTGSGNVGGSSGLVFTNVEALAGGSGQDTYVLGDGASFGGTIDGGSGQNGLDYSAYATAVAVDLAGGTATGTTRITNIGNVTGGAGDDTLTGDAKANILRGGAGADTLTGAAGHDTLEGGAGADTFVFSDGWNNDTLDAGTDSDTLDMTAVTTDVVVTLHSDGTVSATDSTNHLTHVAGIDAILCGSGDNRIVFQRGASFSGTIDAGSGGNNTVDFSDYRTPVLVDLSTGTVTVGGSLSGTTVLGLNTTTPVRYLNNGAGVAQATVTLETLLSSLNHGSGVHTAALSLTRGTLLSSLNNGLGVHTATLMAATSLTSFPVFDLDAGDDLQITLTTGEAIRVDLGTPATLGQVLDLIQKADSRLAAAINSSGTGIDISDMAGGLGNLVVADLGSSTLAASLGLVGTGTGRILYGRAAAYDLRITLTDWSSVLVDIGSATTVGAVLDAIMAADSRVTAVINAAGTGIDVSDMAGGEEYLTADNLNGSTTAADLGLTGSSTGSLLNGTTLVHDLLLTLSDGSTLKVSLAGATTVGEAIDAINATDSRIYAELNEAGDAIQITDATAGSGNLTGSNLAGSTAATDLGLATTGSGALLEGQSLVNDLRITLTKGTAVSSVEVNLGNPTTISEVLAAIQAADSRLTAAINADGDGINIIDSTGSTLTIASLNGCSAAEDLGIAGTGTGGTLTGTAILGSAVDTTFTNVQNAVGGSADDVFIGTSGNNRFSGRDGSDTYRFTEGWGTDTIEDDGTTGTDTLDFSGVTSDLTITIQADGKVTVTAGANTLEDAEGIDAIIAGSGSDVFKFENGARFDGALDGGTGGTNTLDFSQYVAAVVVDLAAGTAQASGTTTTISHFVDVTGGSAGDTLTGDANANRLEGRDGNDTLAGGQANDTLVGGSGDDTYVITADGGTETITELAGGGVDTLDYSSYTAGMQWTVGGTLPGITGAANVEKAILAQATTASRARFRTTPSCSAPIGARTRSWTARPRTATPWTSPASTNP